LALKLGKTYLKYVIVKNHRKDLNLKVDSKDSLIEHLVEHLTLLKMNIKLVKILKKEL